MENDSGFCLDCSHKHRGLSLCAYCDCNWQINREDNMIKKIVKWIWNIVCWPIKKAKQWIWG